MLNFVILKFHFCNLNDLFQPKRHDIPDDKFDTVSINTMQTGMTDMTDADLTQLYRRFNFEHRSEANLPVTSNRDHIVDMINTNSVVVIQGPTGCGKTTQVPQYILDNSYKTKTFCNIIGKQLTTIKYQRSYNFSFQIFSFHTYHFALNLH